MTTQNNPNSFPDKNFYPDKAMEDNVIYFSSNLKCAEIRPGELTTTFILHDDGTIQIKPILFDHFTEEQINLQVEELQAYVVEQKGKLSGNFTIAIETEHGPEFKIIKLTNKKKTEIDATARVISKPIKEETERKRQPSIAEKLRLVIDFIKENERTPSADEYYKEVKIGTFWIKLQQDKDMFDQVARETGLEARD